MSAQATSGNVETARSTRRNDLANGSAKDSPIELVVFGFACTNKDADGNPTAVTTVREVLLAIEPVLAEEQAINVRKLQVALSEGGPEHQPTIRIRWHEAMWMRDSDLMAGMQLVMDELRKFSLEIFWANAKKTDCRNRATFTRQLKADIQTPLGDTTYPPLSEPDPTAWMATNCPDAHSDIARSTILEPAAGSDENKQMVQVDFYHPSSVDLVEQLFRDHYFAYHVRTFHGVSQFQRATNQILTTSPATIVSPRRFDYDADDVLNLLQELDTWTDLYNSTFHAAKCILEIDGQRGRLVHDEHFVVVLSSVGLAEFITRQTPSCGHPYELLYELNGRDLVPPAEAEASAKAEQAFKAQVARTQLEAAVAQKEAAVAQKAAAVAQKNAADAAKGATLLEVEQMHDSAAIMGHLFEISERQRLIESHLKRDSGFDSENEELKSRKRYRPNPPSEAEDDPEDTDQSAWRGGRWLWGERDYQYECEYYARGLDAGGGYRRGWDGRKVKEWYEW